MLTREAIGEGFVVPAAGFDFVEGPDRLAESDIFPGSPNLHFGEGNEVVVRSLPKVVALKTNPSKRRLRDRNHQRRGS